MSRERINEEVVVQSLLRGDKEAKRQLLEHIRYGDVILYPHVQKRLASAIAEDSEVSDDAEDVLSVYCHDHYLSSERCISPEALNVLIVSLKKGSTRVKVFLCEYMKKHSFDDAMVSLLIDSLNYPQVKSVLKSYLEATQSTMGFDQKGHMIFNDSKQRLINLAKRGNSDAQELYLSYVYALGKNRAFCCEEELQCIDFMSKGISGFKEALIKNHSSLKGKLRLLELMRKGSEDAYEVLYAHGIASFGDETEANTIELLAKECKGAKELLLQHVAKHYVREENVRKLQRLAERGSKDAEEILSKYRASGNSE